MKFWWSMMLLLALLSISACFSSREYRHYEQHHGMSKECCQANNGSWCGRVVSTCCKQGCVSKFYGQFCKQDEQLEVDCSKLSCLETCKSKGGVICGVSISAGSIDCCAKQDCQDMSLKDNTTSLSIVDRLMDKAIDFGKDKILGLIWHQQQKHNLFLDTIASKIIGRNDLCRAGKAIKLGKCIKDSKVDLIKARMDNGV